MRWIKSTADNARQRYLEFGKIKLKLDWAARFKDILGVLKHTLLS